MQLKMQQLMPKKEKNPFQTSCQAAPAPSQHREVEINRMTQFTFEVQPAAAPRINFLPIVLKGVGTRNRTAQSSVCTHAALKQLSQ